MTNPDTRHRAERESQRGQRDIIEGARSLGANVIGPALAKLADKHPSIGEVRGLGAFWGLDLVTNRETRAPLVPYNASGPAAQPMADIAAALFVNPNAGRRWTHCVLRDYWLRAAKSVGLEGVRLYEGTKHTMATDAVRRGVAERALQAFLGHRDARSTRRYARLSDEALVTVLRPRSLSPVCRQPIQLPAKPLKRQARMASPTGIEPVLPP